MNSIRRSPRALGRAIARAAENTALILPRVDVMDVIVVGGGFAGLCAAARVAAAGARVVLLEQEEIWASHASGRNAAIWLPVGELASTWPLARASEAWLTGLLGDAWIRRCGALITANDPATVDPLAATAPEAGCRATAVTADEAARLCPALRGGSVRAALVVEGAGEMDIHAMTEGVVAEARRLGVAIRTRAQVVALSGKGVRLADGSDLAAGAVVLAGGAWAGGLGGLPLHPLRRHLAQLVVPDGVDVGTRVVWHAEPEVYFRPETVGVLASPCDEAEHAPGVPPADPAVLRSLAARLRAIAPALGDARVARSWACLRTFAPDRELVVGADPRTAGLWWMAGFGGRGMTVAPGAAEVLLAAMEGRAHALGPRFDPARLLAPAALTASPGGG